jgi:hypothetical protein
MTARRIVKPQLVSLGLALLALSGCSEAEAAKRVDLQVVADGRGLEPITTDLGYEVELSSAVMVAEDLQFTTAGEAHASLWRRISDTLIRVARAHPGHYQGGEVTGELQGHFVLRFIPGETHEVGTATLLVGQYSAVKLTLAHATSDDVAEDEPLLDHSARLVGSASRDDSTVEFEITLSSPDARQLVGIPFTEEITEATPGPLVVRLLTLDPLEKDTLFDGVDFAVLDADADGQVLVDPAATDTESVAAYNLFRRTFQTHDHFVVQSEE